MTPKTLNYVLIAVLTGMSLWHGSTKSGSQSVVRAKRFILEDSNGRSCAELVTVSNDPTLLMRGSRGEMKLWIRVLGDQAEIRVFKAGTVSIIQEQKLLKLGKVEKVP